MVRLPAHLTGAPAGERTVSRAELSGHQRDRVVAKATPTFAARGYQATTVDDILAAARVGVGNFYSLFGGKEDCFLACLDHAVEDAARRINAAAAVGSDWDEKAFLGLGAALEYVSGERSGAVLILIEAQCAGPEAARRYHAMLDRAVVWLRGGRAAHPAASGLPPSFEQASIPGLAFYLQRCLADEDLPASATLFAESAELLLGPLLGSKALGSLRRELAGTH